MTAKLVRSRALLAAISAAALVTACGGGGGDATTAATSPVTSPPSGTTDHAPTISGQPGTSVAVGQAYDFKPTASDSDGDALTFSVMNNPAWLTLNAKTGELSGTPAAGNVGTAAGITLSVSDGQDSTALTAFSVTVTQIATGSATLTWAAPTANSDGSTLSDLSGFKVIYGRSAGTLDQTVSLTNPTLSTYVLSNLSPGTWYFALVAVNSKGVESTPTNVISTTI